MATPANTSRKATLVWVNPPGLIMMKSTPSSLAGLYAAGEMVGGLFYYNYPGGTGLTSGAVFGKLAGDSAGKAVTQK